jgi:hypothetical protein
VDSDTAKVVLAGIAGVAVIIWLSGFQFLVWTSREARDQTGEGDGALDEVASAEGTVLTGAAEVDGEPGQLAARTASLLARGALFPNVPLKVVEASNGHVRFERIETGGEGQAADRWLRQGQLSFSSLPGGRSRVEWAVELSNMHWLLRLGAMFLIAGLIAIVVVFWVLLTYVVPSPAPGIRWQVVQMVQVVHLLWPPFLCAALYRRGRRGVAARMQALANNLPYLGEGR